MPFGTHNFYQAEGRGGGRGKCVGQISPAISKSVAPMNVKFCRVLERDRRKSGVKTGKKLTFSQGNQGKLFQFCSGRIEAVFLHILDPNYPSFYLKCPRKCQKPIILTFSQHLPKFAPRALPNFGVEPLEPLQSLVKAAIIHKKNVKMFYTIVRSSTNFLTFYASLESTEKNSFNERY